VTPARRDAILAAFLQETLRAGIPYWWRPRGFSMRPTIDDGDRVLVARIEPADLRVGDIVKFQFDGQLLMHRLIALGPEDRAGRLTFRGDNAFRVEHVSPEDVIGRAVAVEHLGRVVPLRRSAARRLLRRVFSVADSR